MRRMTAGNQPDIEAASPDTISGEERNRSSHEFFLSLTCNFAIDNGKTLAEFQQAARGEKISRLRFPQKVDVEICGNGKRDRSNMSQDHDVSGQVGKRHHGRT